MRSGNLWSSQLESRPCDRSITKDKDIEKAAPVLIPAVFYHF